MRVREARSAWKFAVVGLVGLGLSFSLVQGVLRSGNRMHLIAPIYNHDPSAWGPDVQGMPGSVLAVINPASGPGTAPDPSVSSFVAHFRAHGDRILGYLPTQWADGGVSLATAEAWVGDYYAWYALDGVFVDQVNSSCAATTSNYYRLLFDYVKANHPQSTVVLNPGTPTGECYASYSDILVTFEGPSSSYASGFQRAAWMSSYPSSRFAIMVYSVQTVAEMEGVVDLASARGVGWVFVTDRGGGGNSPYDLAPQYLAEEAQYVHYVSSGPGSLALLQAASLGLGALAVPCLTYEAKIDTGNCSSKHKTDAEELWA